MGIIKSIKFLLGMSGSNFTKREKNSILIVLEEYKEHIFECVVCYDECDNMSLILHEELEEVTYSKLTTLYHNYSFYSKKISATMDEPWFWRTTDYLSRFRAVEMLRTAVIND